MINVDMEIKEMKVVTRDGKDYLVFDLHTAPIPKDAGIAVLASSKNGICFGGLHVMEN